MILSFLQDLLDKGRSTSTLKIYVGSYISFHAPIAGQDVGRNNLIVRFLRGSRRLNPPRPSTVPTWDLPTVLRALPFRAQVITLSVLPPSAEDQELNLLCPVRSLRIYIERFAPFRQSEQHFVCFGSRTKGSPGHKAEHLSMVEAIALAYSSLGLQSPIEV